MAMRTIVGSPLAPAMLETLEAIGEFPATASDFSPEGNWTNTYRIWTCHGYREEGNHEVGHLRIERAGGGSRGSFMLVVDQHVVNEEAVSNIIHAEIRCNGDEIASPRSWELTSRFTGTDGKDLPDLAHEETARVKGGAIEVRVNGQDFSRKGSPRLTGDWCLFDAVQRQAFDEAASVEFDLFEGLSLMRKGHRLSYRGEVVEAGTPMHRFVQIGSGVLPYEYWLDGQRRLLMAITFSRAYILDDKAEEITRRKIEEGISSYQRRLSQKKEGDQA